MKKVFFAALFAGCVLSLAAQSGAVDVSKYRNVGLLDVDAYVQNFKNPGTNLTDTTYIMNAKMNNKTEANRIARINDNGAFDTAEEIVLLSVTTGVINVRPVEAAEMLPASDPVLIDLQLGAMLYMKKAVVSFLGGGDPAKYAAEIKFITGWGRVTEADIKDFVRQGIAEVVDEEYHTRVFFLKMGNKSYTTTLTQNSNRSYTIQYELNTVENDDEAFTRPNLDALLDELKRRGFTSGNCDTVRRQSTLFPALSRIDGVTDKNTIDLIKYLLTDFYTTNDQITKLNDYKALVAIYNRYNSVLLTSFDAVDSAMGAMGKAIATLSPELSKIFEKDAAFVIASSRQQSQQVKTRLMSNDIDVLASTVGELNR
jgi:hypothetical protein